MSLFAAMNTIRSIFEEHAGKDGDQKTLSKAEVADLLKSEGFLTQTADKSQLDNFFTVLDADKSGCVNFKEFVTFTAALLMICNPE